MNLQGQDPEIAHHFFDLWQDSLESQFSKMLADHRPCHYAIDNGNGQVIWVPKHTPCWFESQSGKLIIDTHTNGSRWLPALHSGPAKLMQVCLTSSVGMEESTVAVPGLSFPRRQAWQKLPALELNLSEGSRADCCPLARVRIYTEELRALRTALQLMVKRAEAKSTAEASLQPASSAMEPIQEGGSEADGSGSSPAEEEATREPAQGDADPLGASQPRAPAEAAHTKSRSASPARGCGCFGFGSRRPSSAKLPNKAAHHGLSQALDKEPPSTPRTSEKAATNRGLGSPGSESVPGDAGLPGTNEDDSAMLFYHETSLHDAGPNGGQATPTVAEQTEREHGSCDDSAMAFDASQDVSAGNSAVHPMPIGLSGGTPRTTLQPLETSECTAPSAVTEGPAHSVEDLPSLGPAVRLKKATGASLPALMLSTVQAIGLEGSHGYSHSVPLGLDALDGRHPDDGNASEAQFLDTARGPRGAYRDAPRGTQQAAQLSGHMSLPIRPHVWDAARMVAESRAACKEVWAPGYDHSPGHSDSEDHQGTAPKTSSVASPKPAQGSELLLESSQQRSQSPDVQSIPPPIGDHPFLLATVPIQLQSPPERDPESPAEEQSVLLIQPSVEFVTAAMSKLGSPNISGQSMGSQGSMLLSESRKLAHVALRAKDLPVKSRHLSATPGDILRMRQALGRFPKSGLSAPPDRQATQPLLAAQPAQNSPELPMQPALSLVDWTNVQAATVLGMEHQPQSPRQDDAGNRSNSDVEIDSPFASNSLPREGQQTLPRRINKYAGTSDIIYEDLNNPFDKYRDPPRARRGRNHGKRNSTGSKGSSSSPSKSPATAATPAAEPDLAGSPATRQSASASDAPAQSADTSSTPSPTRGAGMAPDSSAARAPGYTSGGTTSPGSFSDDSENTPGTPQDTPSEAYAEQVQPGAIAVAASELAAESQPAAATVIVSGGAERVLHAPHDAALTPTPGFPSHPSEAAAAKGPALQDASSPDSFTQPGSQPVDIPFAHETEIAEHAQAGQAAEIPAIGVSDTLMVLEPVISQQAQRQDSAAEGDTYYDAVPEQASLRPPASAAASSALEVQASPSEQTEPDRTEPVQESPSHAPAQHPEAEQEPETPTSHHASSTAESLGQVIGSTRQTVKESRLADAGTVHTKDAEKHVAVSLRVRRSQPAGLVAATIAALGLSSKAGQTPQESIRVRIMPLKEATSRSRVALDPEQMDATWYSSLLMSSATPARGPREPPAVSSGSRAAPQRADANESPDRAAVAAARLAEAGRGPKSCVRHISPPAPEVKAPLSSQDGPVVNMSEVPIPNARQTLHAAVDGEGETPEEVAPPDEAAAVSSAMGVRHGSVHPSAQAAADVALLPADGISTAGPPAETLPETASGLPDAPSIQKQRNEPGIATTGSETPAQDVEPSMDVTPQTSAPSTDASPEQKVLQEQPDQAAAKITPANQARRAATTLKQRLESPQQHSEAAAAAAGRTGSAALPLPAKPQWERSDQPIAAATLGGGAMLARCASDAAQQAQRNRALVSELKQHLQTSGPRPSAGPTALKRKPSVQSPTIALGSPHERGLLYKPEMQSVADRVRYIERIHSRNAPPLSALTAQSSLPHLPTTSQAAAL